MINTIKLAVDGMTCQHCVNSITSLLQAIPGVDSKSVTVSLEKHTATFVVRETPELLCQQAIESIEDAGYDVYRIEEMPSEVMHYILKIQDMTSSHNVDQIKDLLDKYAGVISGSVKIARDSGVVYVDTLPNISASELVLAIADLGFQVEQTTVNDPTVDPSSNTHQVSIPITGMTCSHCVRTVTSTLQELQGVVPGSVSVSLELQLATLQSTYKIDVGQIRQAIESAGYKISNIPRITCEAEQNTMTQDRDSFQNNEESDEKDDTLDLVKVVMRIHGMTCEACVANVTSALTELPDVQKNSIRVFLSTNMAMFIAHEPNIDTIRDAIDNRGYTADNIQIVHNLLPILPESEVTLDTKSVTPTILGAVTIDTPTMTEQKKVTLQIRGMTCASCVSTMERCLAKLPSVDPDSVNVNLLTGTGSFSMHGEALDEATIETAVENLGYDATNIAIITEPTVLPKNLGKDVKSVEMIISGMFCAECVEKTRNALSGLPGVSPSTVSVDLDTGRVSFSFTKDMITRQRIKQTILSLGFIADSIVVTKQTDKTTTDSENQIVTTRLTVTGMTCSSCVANIERNILKMPGIARCQVNLLAKVAEVVHDPSITGARDLANMIEQLGYRAEITRRASDDTLTGQRETIRKALQDEIVVLRRRFLWSLLFAIPTVLIHMIFMLALSETNPVREAFMTLIIPGLSVGDLIQFILATPTQFWLGLPFYTKAYRSIVYARTANMETLVALGTTVAYAASVGSIIAAIVQKKIYEDEMSINYFETSVLLITFIHFGKWLESLAKGKTADTITKLMDLQPERATLVKYHERLHETDEKLEESEIDAKDIQVGDLLKVNAGGRIPCDGKVWRGITTADESMITGESKPVTKKPGDEVISATINTSATIYIRAIRVGTDTTLSRIIQLVQDAQASPKAPIEHLADKISSVFVPVVIGLAISTFVIWEIVGMKNLYPENWVPMGEDKTLFSLMLAVSVLVIACPCGLGLASPTAVMVGTGVAARYGVLIKGGGQALEMANRITSVAFDKTGTITLGKPQVVRSWIQGKELQSEQNGLWHIFRSVSAQSHHPLSKSILSAAKEKLTDNSSSDINIIHANEVPGRGVTVTLTLSAQLANQLEGRLHGVRSLNVFLGSQEWMDEHHARFDHTRQAQECKAQVQEWQTKGYSIVMISAMPVNGHGTTDKVHIDGCQDACACAECFCDTRGFCCSASRTMMLGQFALADMPRPEAAQVIESLKRRGIEVWMITGDHPRTGQTIGGMVGIDSDHILSQVKPEQKADKIRNLQQRGIQHKAWGRTTRSPAVVAMIGDGINDSPALAQADVGISVGSATDIAIEAASVVLIRNSLLDLITMIDVSCSVVRRIRINFGWAFGYNIVAIPIAAGILYPGTGQGLPTYVAGLAMVLSSISVVCSSLLLRFYRPPSETTKSSMKDSNIK